jgi:hypothetical protein
MDPFAVIIFGGIAALVIFCLLLGRFYPGSGAEVLDWRPTAAFEQRVAAEVDDLDQMLEATNARRRRRGEPELTEHALHEQVRRDLVEADRRREEYLARQDLEQLLEAKNARRRRRGLPELTLDQVRADVDTWRAS